MYGLLRLKVISQNLSELRIAIIVSLHSSASVCICRSSRRQSCGGGSRKGKIGSRPSRESSYVSFYQEMASALLKYSSLSDSAQGQKAARICSGWGADQSETVRVG